MKTFWLQYLGWVSVRKAFRLFYGSASTTKELLAMSYIFWNVKLCSPLKVNRLFWRTNLPYPQGRRMRQARNLLPAGFMLDFCYLLHAGFLLGLCYLLYASILLGLCYLLHACFLLDLCYLLQTGFFLSLLLDAKDRDNMLLRNVDWFPTDYTTLHPGR